MRKYPISFVSNCNIYFVLPLLFANVALFCMMMRAYRQVNTESLGHTKCSTVVVSLATFGARTFNIKEVIQSLMDQTVKADMIVVHVSLESRAGSVSKEQLFSFFSNEFDSCIDSGYVHNGIQCGKLLILPGKDFGPATKVLGTLMLPMLDPQACIVSVDDDMLYDKNLVAELVSRAPDDGALGFSCEEVPAELDLVRFFSPSSLWWHTISGGTGWKYPFDDVLECKGWLHGYQGILYRRKFFGDDVFAMESTMPRGCFYADDVRLAGYLWTKGFKRYVHPHFVRGGVLGIGGRETYTVLEKNATSALSLIPNTMQERQWPCVQHFGWD